MNFTGRRRCNRTARQAQRNADKNAVNNERSAPEIVTEFFGAPERPSGHIN